MTSDWIDNPVEKKVEHRMRGSVFTALVECTPSKNVIISNWKFEPPKLGFSCTMQIVFLNRSYKKSSETRKVIFFDDGRIAGCSSRDGKILYPKHEHEIKEAIDFRCISFSS